MYLKSLVCKGFKSFADRGELKLEPGLTAVVGPNGSGKSNISDAVLWVLGERNAKNLRGQVMEDVIFAGSKTRKSVSVAQVDLVLDNSDGELPVDYTEVTISRRMYRTGESEYLINGATVRRMDILDILHDSGLGTGTQSLISQGNLDSILQSKPEDRRALIEEAAGVLKHKQRKEKSKHKLEQMDQHLARVKDVVSEVERQIGPLERKAKRAIAYKEVSAELSDLNLALAVDDLRILQKKWDEATSNESELSKKVSTSSQEIEEAEKEVERLQEILQSQTNDTVDVSQKARNLSTYQQRFETSLVILGERKRAAVQKINDARESISILTANSNEEEPEFEQLSLLEEVKTKREEADVLVASLIAQHDKKTEERIAAEQKAFEILKKRRTTESDLEELKKTQSRAEQSSEINLSKRDLIKSSIAELVSQLSEAQNIKEKSQSECISAEERLNQAQELATHANQAYQQADEQLVAVKKSLQDAKDVIHDLEIEILGLTELERMSQCYNDQTRDWIENQKNSTKFIRLIDAIEVEEGFEDYVDAVLGNDAELIIADSSNTASKLANEFMNSSIDSRLSLGLLREQSSYSFDKIEQYGDPLINHVTFKKGYESLGNAVFGNVCIVTDYKVACESFTKANFPLTFIGKDKTFISATGKASFVGGDFKHVSGSVARKQRLENANKELIEQNKLLDQLQSQQEEISKRVEGLHETAINTSRSAAETEGQFQSAKHTLETSIRNVESIEDKLNRSKENYAQIDEAYREAENTAKSLSEKIQEAQKLIDDINEEQKRANELLDPLRKEESKSLEELNAAKLELARISERHAFIEQGIEQNKTEMEKKQKQLQDAKETIAINSAIVSRIEVVSPLFTNLSLSCKNRAAVLDAQILASKDTTDFQATQAAQARTRAREARDEYNQLAESLSEVRVEKGRLEIQVTSAINTITKDCKVPLETALKIEPLEHREETEELAGRLRRRIANMGTINPDAANEYEEVKLRYDFLCGQLKDLTDARSSLSKIDKVIEQKMKDDFVLTFDQVNQNFQEVFAVLFPGGNAHLDLVDPQDPENTGVEVVAQPKGKRVTKMMLLSGGEKSLVALALLFAVYKTRSTPFYILDEVEAALDDSNLRRLLRYLDELRASTQLIMITHQRRTMEMADILFGVSMGSDGVTKVISQKLDRALKYAED